MLNRLDDYPVHQTAEPVAHPGTSDRNAYDRYFFNGYTRDGELFFAAALGVYPNRRVMDAAFSVVRGGRQHSLYASRLAPRERTETRTGPIAVEVVEPMRSLRLRVEAPDPGIEADLLFRARTVAVEEPRITRRAGTRVVMDSTRFTQHGVWSGSLALGGDRVAVEPAQVLGSRDRSWGVRGVGEREAGAPAGGAPQFYWLWAPLHFDDACTHFGLNEDAGGRAWHRNGSRVRAFDPDAVPPPDDAESVEVMDRVAARIDWEPGTRRSRGARLTLEPRAGAPHEIELEPLLTFQMVGIGYGHPEWGHGRWKGPEATGSETFALADVDPLDPRHIHIQQLCRARMDGREGVGVLEQLVIGRHDPSGFKDLLDGAPG